ncbi:Alpha/Beta hydrolase protein [Microdochium bolleyi]|uniref:Alpha/Beta hydrolase protein n=1 Tax=Microdochium bolleyi TaxID=196109 RepID=A0A136IZM5_9PEZI|nr:Alpha/Beta hydrolase protein [Microdochium bolleyi]
MSPYPPTIAQAKASPAFPAALWDLQPSQSGILAAGASRRSPANVSWEIHGDGPIKVILICGLGLVKADLQNQTLFLGHTHGDKYSLLLVDNRGTGGSAAGTHFHRTSTSAMAHDILEVADHIGWTGHRQLHVGGGSMGGMIAQELALAAPTRICSLSLWSTTARYERSPRASWLQGIWESLQMVLPKPLEEEIRHFARIAYTPEWLAAPDDVELPEADTPRCSVPPGGIGRFENNYERFVAVEVQKRQVAGSLTFSGFVMHAVAAATHHKSPEQLRKLADEVGRERIMVLHGVQDQAMPVELGKKLIEAIRPGTSSIVDGLGHAPIHERPRWFNDLLAERFEAGEKDKLRS